MREQLTHATLDSQILCLWCVFFSSLFVRCTRLGNQTRPLFSARTAPLPPSPPLDRKWVGAIGLSVSNGIHKPLVSVRLNQRYANSNNTSATRAEQMEFETLNPPQLQFTTLYIVLRGRTLALPCIPAYVHRTSLSGYSEFYCFKLWMTMHCVFVLCRTIGEYRMSRRDDVRRG